MTTTPDMLKPEEEPTGHGLPGPAEPLPDDDADWGIPTEINEDES